MKLAIRLIAITSLFVLIGCGSVSVVTYNKTKGSTRQDMDQISASESSVLPEDRCQECFVVPKSGSNRDLRRGYYFDQEEGKCKLFLYGSGAGCIRPPFKILNECISCCGGRK